MSPELEIQLIAALVAVACALPGSIIAMNADRLTVFNFCDFLKSIFQGALGGNVYFHTIQISY